MEANGIERPAILVVDDDPLLLEFIQALLEEEGFRVTASEGGVEALDLIQTVDWDLVLTDLRMPVVDGFEIIKTVNQKRPHTPVVILTGEETVDNAVQAIHSGAYDFITKSLLGNPSLLSAAVGRGLEKRALLQSQRRHLFRIENQNRILLEDLRAARHIQRSMIDRDFSRFAPRLKVTCRYFPADHVGGDFFDVVSLGSDRVLFYMADVAGHGVSAAMVTVFARQVMRKLAAAAGRTAGNQVPRPQDFFWALNREVTGQGFEWEGVPLYLTVFLGVLDLGRKVLHYSNAGHRPSPRHFRRDGSIAPLDLDGSAIGLVEAPEFEEGWREIRPGERVFLCTDGLSRTAGEEGDIFGEERLDRLLARHAGDDDEALAETIISAVIAHRQARPQEDDVSVMLVSATDGRVASLGGPPSARL
ncbi:MAG: SpoIIE family protein phosphatase [Thermodesulfobacteriota bacterium]